MILFAMMMPPGFHIDIRHLDAMMMMLHASHYATDTIAIYFLLSLITLIFTLLRCRHTLMPASRH